jgi:hypothetical protein
MTLLDHKSNKAGQDISFYDNIGLNNHDVHYCPYFSNFTVIILSLVFIILTAESAVSRFINPLNLDYRTNA